MIGNAVDFAQDADDFVVVLRFDHDGAKRSQPRVGGRIGLQIALRLHFDRQADLAQRDRHRAQPIAPRTKNRDFAPTARAQFFRAVFFQPARELVRFDARDLAVFQFFFAVEQVRPESERRITCPGKICGRG